MVNVTVMHNNNYVRHSVHPGPSTRDSDLNPHVSFIIHNSEASLIGYKEEQAELTPADMETVSHAMETGKECNLLFFSFLIPIPGKIYTSK